jgi:transcriptional regulator with XRE-family HTH domain
MAQEEERFKKFVGRRIKAARKALDMQQADIAAQVHVLEDTYGSWERGTRLVTTDHLPALSHALHRPINYFLGVPDEHNLEDDERLLVELYRDIGHPVMQKQLIVLARSMAEITDEAPIIDA